MMMRMLRELNADVTVVNLTIVVGFGLVIF